MNVGIPPEHPDDDLLADLAADVLPTHQARVVEAHVMACQRCTALLTDAAQVRNLLLTDEPGPIPEDVLARIDQALQVESAAWGETGNLPAQPAPIPASGYSRPAQPPAAKPPVRVITPWEDTTTIEAFAAVRKRQVATRKTREPADAVAMPASPSGISADRGRGPRLTRPSRGPSRSRRDLREEVRDVRAGRRGTVLAAAAGTVILLGLGGYVVVGLFGNRNTESAVTSANSVEAAGKAPAAAGSGPPVLHTGTNYGAASLAAQAKALVGQAASGGTGQRPMLHGAAGATADGASEPAAAGAGNESLRDPAALNGCLSELQTGGRRPVVVDLAKFDGRDAAVIVLNGVNGGYEVWAVARDCRPGADGTMTYLDLTR